MVLMAERQMHNKRPRAVDTLMNAGVYICVVTFIILFFLLGLDLTGGIIRAELSIVRVGLLTILRDLALVFALLCFSVLISVRYARCVICGRWGRRDFMLERIDKSKDVSLSRRPRPVWVHESCINDTQDVNRRIFCIPFIE